MTKDPDREAQDLVKSMKSAALRDTPTTAAAELLGVSPSTLRKWVNEGTAEAIMLGGQLRFKRDQVRRLFHHPPGTTRT